jgi:CRP/FNR family transcriptional regulator, nitrogen fixation regulation protein
MDSPVEHTAFVISPSAILEGASSIPSFKMRFDREQEIYGEGEPAEYVYRVVSGAVRTCTFDAEGRRQIGGFYLPGDFFGVENSDTHRFCAEALATTELALFPVSALAGAAEKNKAIARALWSLMAAELSQAREHMLVVGKKSALERLVSFLNEMGKRACNTSMDLPMSRVDIADYLGLTIETVSRMFSKLERDHAIALNGARQVTLKSKLNTIAMAA